MKQKPTRVVRAWFQKALKKALDEEFSEVLQGKTKPMSISYKQHREIKIFNSGLVATIYVKNDIKLTEKEIDIPGPVSRYAFEERCPHGYVFPDDIDLDYGITLKNLHLVKKNLCPDGCFKVEIKGVL